MITSKLVRHIFIPAAALVSAKSNQRACKPSELPIYTADEPKENISEPSTPPPPTAIEEAFGTVRRSIFSFMSQVEEVRGMGEAYVRSAFRSAGGLITYLQEEDNTTPKYGAIAMGGMAGLIFGLRGGRFKRMFYASTGATSMAALCYPKEATEYSQIAITEAKRYTTIAYNFINGVKKDDPPLSLPSFPTSISEAWDAAKSLGKSSKSLVTDSADEGEAKIQVSETNSIDPLDVVTEAHQAAVSKSCHCPVGSCMGQHEESVPINPIELVTPVDIPITIPDEGTTESGIC